MASLSAWSEVQTCICPSWCHCHSLSLASVKYRLVLPFWYRPTQVVPDKGPLNGCVYVCVFCSLDTGNGVLVGSSALLVVFVVLFTLTVLLVSISEHCRSHFVREIFKLCEFVRLLFAFSASTLLVGRQEEHLVCKNWVMMYWCGYLSGARCRLFACGPADTTASQNPVISCLIEIQTDFTYLVPAYPGCPGKEAVQWL